ncbi:MAG: branched-chain amino acid ABC transporter permease [Nocardioidaceae bacterium]
MDIDYARKQHTQRGRGRPFGSVGRLWKAFGRSTWNQVLLLLLVVAGVYWFVPDPGLAISILIFALWAASLNLLLGYGGLLSFGHALPFGYGGYAAGLVLLHFSQSLWLALLTSVVVAGVLAILVGYVSLLRSGIYFAMLTLAFAQLGYFIAFQARSITGGDNGLTIATGPVLGLLGGSVPMNAIRNPNGFYLLTAAIVLAVFSFLVLYTDSPLGRVLAAIRENEERASGCGYNTRAVKLITFAVSSMAAGLAGGLYAMSNLFVGLQPYWLLSGTVVIMVVLGGRSTLFGPVLGAITFLVLEHYLSQQYGHWQIIVGAIFVACVLLFPQGLWGLVRLERVRGRRRARRKEEPIGAPE